MNRNNMQRQVAMLQRKLQQLQIPRGAQGGALAGPPAQPQMPQQVPAVPQGADQGALAGCGVGGSTGAAACGMEPIPSPFAGYPPYEQQPTVINYSLLGVFVQPATSAATTLEISCGNTFFNSCGARSFGSAQGRENLLTSIVSGFDTTDQLCPGSGIDVAFFQTDQCFCPFDFGCFSNLAPLLMTFDPIDTQSVLAPLDMVLVGRRLEFDGCFPFPGASYGPMPGPGGPGMPVPGGGIPGGFGGGGGGVPPGGGGGWYTSGPGAIGPEPNPHWGQRRW